MNIKTIIILTTLISACTYSVYTNAYSHLKTLKIEAFINSTDEFTLENEVLGELTDLFSKDKRLTIVNKKPNALISGKILDYSNKILASSTIEKQEFTVKILFEIQFTDIINKEIIFESKALLLSENYTADNSDLESKTEEDARKKIFSDLYEKIMLNTLEKW